MLSKINKDDGHHIVEMRVSSSQFGAHLVPDKEMTWTTTRIRSTQSNDECVGLLCYLLDYRCRFPISGHDALYVFSPSVRLSTRPD